jgi:hypothetical protein
MAANGPENFRLVFAQGWHGVCCRPAPATDRTELLHLARSPTRRSGVLREFVALSVRSLGFPRRPVVQRPLLADCPPMIVAVAVPVGGDLCPRHPV